MDLVLLFSNLINLLTQGQDTIHQDTFNDFSSICYVLLRLLLSLDESSLVEGAMSTALFEWLSTAAVSIH